MISRRIDKRDLPCWIQSIRMDLIDSIKDSKSAFVKKEIAGLPLFDDFAAVNRHGTLYRGR